jgi:hypothetical protein
MSKRLTVEEVDKRLLERGIKRLGEYVYTKTPCLLKCLKETCGCEWQAIPNNIFKGGGCPRCSGCERLTNEIIDQRLIGRDIKRIGECKRSMTKTLWGCLICNHEWQASPGDIFQGNGCPRCSGLERLTNEIIDQRLVGRGIKRLGECKGSRTKTLWGCLKESCGFEWQASPNHIFRGCGCPRCASSKGERKVAKWLEAHNIIFIPQHRFNDCKD